MKAAQIGVLMVLLTVLGLCTIWQRVRITELGYGIRRLERQKEQFTQRHRELTCEIAALSTPAAIQERLDGFRVELVQPPVVARLKPLARAVEKTSMLQASMAGRAWRG